MKGSTSWKKKVTEVHPNYNLKMKPNLRTGVQIGINPISSPPQSSLAIMSKEN